MFNWHYDILFVLKVMAEAGFIDDKRCNNAIDILLGKSLEDGGFAVEEKFYTLTEKHLSGRSIVNWGKVSKKN